MDLLTFLVNKRKNPMELIHNMSPCIHKDIKKGNGSTLKKKKLLIELQIFCKNNASAQHHSLLVSNICLVVHYTCMYMYMRTRLFPSVLMGTWTRHQTFIWKFPVDSRPHVEMQVMKLHTPLSYHWEYKSFCHGCPSFRNKIPHFCGK